MKYRRAAIAFASLGLAALVFAACADQGDTFVTTGPDTAGISASGHGEVEVVPDTGVVSIGVEVTRTTVAEARDEAARVATRLIDSAKGNKVDDKDIRTTGLSIYPRYEYKRDEEPRITGYTVTNTVTIKVRDLDTFSKTVDDAVEAGGDATRLQGIGFTVEDRDEAIEKARELAVADAKGKAEQLARAAGVELDKPVSISESFSTPPPIERAAKDLLADAGAATPIEPGTTTVSVDVNIRWEIK